ncbi:MAG: manganese efflux pump MntP family protein [Bacteroidetes bacterium]|nr:manganese efflux pump MntP family protein [Bacteroidota bacterium]
MSFLELILIALGLSMDCFAVSISFGAAKKITRPDALRMAFFFGLFQGLMPLVGWLVGDLFKNAIESFDHWLAFSVLAFIGIKMIVQAFHDDHAKKTLNIRKTSVLLSLSIATSIDALITGVSFGFIRVNILNAAIIITLVTFLVTGIGAKLGSKTHFLSPRAAEILGGVILIGIGLKVLGDHLGIWG